MYYAYCRKSTDAQQETSFEVQRDFLVHQANLLNEAYIILTETGSGSTMADRPVFMNLMASLKPNDILGCYDQSRISRNSQESYIILDTIKQKGARLQVNGKFLNPFDPQDMAIFGIQAVFSDYQRSVQLEKSRKGIKQKYANGDAVFTGSLIGWTLNRYGQATINPEEAEVIRYIFTEFVNGKSLKSLEKELWGKALSRPYKFNIENLRDLIMRPIYMGYYLNEPYMAKHIAKYSEEEIKAKLVKSNIYPPIIQEDLWWSALTRYRTVRTPHSIEYQFRWSPHPLAGVFKCPCGKGISYHHRIRENNRMFETYMFQAHTPACSYGKHISYKMEWLENITLSCFLLTFLAGNEVGMFFAEKKRELEALTLDIDNELTNIDKLHKKEEAKKERLVMAVAEGLLDTASISNQMQKIQGSIDELENRKENLIQQKNLKLADYEDFSMVSSQEILDTYSTHFREYILRFAGEKSTLDTTDKSLLLRFINGKEFKIHYPKRSNTREYPVMIDVSFRGEFQYSFEYHKGQITRMVTDNEYLQPTLDRWKKLTNGELQKKNGIILGF